MRRIFKNVEQEEFFSANGYLKISFEQAGDIDAAKGKIYSLTPSDNFKAFQKTLIHEQDYHCTFFDSNLEYRKNVYEIISDLFGPTCDLLLDQYRIIQANVFIKPPHKGYVAPHQNLTVVDEKLFTSLSFWCPSQDTDLNNGTMVVVPGSHKKFMKYRTTNISWPLLPLFQNYESSLLKAINVKKGELLIIDDSLIHGTTNNITAIERFVFHALIAPSEAKLIYCNVVKEKNKVDLFSVPDMFWQFYIPGDMPHGLDLIEERNYDEVGLSIEEFKSALNGSESH